MKIYSMRKLLLECWIYIILVLNTSASEMLPEFLEEPKSAVIAHHASVTLPCKVEPSSAVVRWQFNGEFIEPGTIRGFSLEGTNLHIKKFKHKPKGESFEGIYQCIAETPFGSVTSRPAKLSKAVLKRFQSREDLHLNVTEGNNVVLPCQPPESSPSAIIYFEVNGTMIKENTDHYRVSSSGNLFINNVSESDHGEYHCIAVNPVTNQTRRANYVIHLYIRNVSSALRQEAVIVTSSVTVQAGDGDDIVLECVAVGMPQPTIKWKKYGYDNSLLFNDRIFVKHGNLHIQNVTFSDHGTYVCNASNGIGDEKIKPMMLEYRELPKVIADTSRVSINPEESVRLHCRVHGQPVPEVVWYHNAVPITGILQVYNGGTTYNINDIQLKHAGYYQCMSSNEDGVAYATIKVEVKEQTVAPSVGNQNTEANSSDHSSTTAVRNTEENRGKSRSKKRKNRKGSAGRRRKERRRNKNRKRKKKPGRRDQFIGDEAKIKLVPPTAPDINQLSDTSVKVNWSVPENDGLAITFFRVQYKIVKPKKGEWKTGDVIPFDARVKEVSNLKAGGTYKFRIAAVYSNDDNKVGPNSAKYTLHLAPFNKPKPPENKPAIVEVRPVEYEENVDKKYGLNIKWNYQPKKTSPIEGFFLYYKPFSSIDDYKKLALFEAGLRSHLLKDLTPNTEYSIKLQCFNAAGSSKNSTPVVKRTGPGPFVPPIIPPVGPEKSLKPEPQKPDTTEKSVVNEVEESSKTGAQSSELLYMIVGIVLGVMMLFLIVFMFMCWWKQRQQRRMMCNLNAMNDAARTKFLDPAQRIYADSLKKKYVNGGYGVNGTVPNGHVPNAYTKMNINVNPLSDVDMQSLCNGHGGNSQYQVSTFVPNGTAPSLSHESDSNFNKINRSLNNSLQCSINHSVHSVQSPDSLGSGEAPACPPSPSTQGSSYVQSGFGLNSDSQEGYSNRSCDHLSGSHGYLSNSVDCGTKHSNDGSLPSDNGGNHMGKHKRRRKRVQQREHATRDQATNTDLSSNEGTLELSTCNKVPCVTQISGHNSPMRTSSSDANHSVTDYPQLSQGV